MTERASGWIGAGLLLVFLTALVSGVSTFVNAYAVVGTNSDAFVTVRNTVVALALLPFAFLAVRPLKAPALRPRDWAALATIGLVGGAVPFLLFFRGLELATAAGGAATAAFGYRTLFLWASGLAVVFLTERPRWTLWGGAALLLVGNVLLLSLTAPIWTEGTGYVLAATVLWAVEYTVSKRVLRELSSTTVALGRMGFGAVFLGGYLAVTAQWAAVTGFSGADWAWIGISAAFLLAFVVSWYAGLKRVDLSTATSVLVLGFPVSWLLSYLFQGHPLSLGAALGALAVVTGAAIAVGLARFRSAGAALVRLFRPSAAPS